MVIGSTLSILLLTEDSGGHAIAVLHALSKKMLRLVEPMADVERVGFDPIEEKVRVAMNANAWKERGPKGDRKRLDLRQSIATRLAHEDGLGFVLFHMDGDCRWADSQGGTKAENLEVFRKLLLPGIEALLLKIGRPERINRLVMVVPFWCMEAWLYQNVDEALRIYKKHHPDAHEDIALFDQTWRADPATLDEVEFPKRRVRIRDQYNLSLATQQFPAARAYGAGKSFALVVESLARCPGLRQALQQLRFDTPPGSRCK